MSVICARRNFRKLPDRAERGERIVITGYGKPFVAVIPIADLEFLRRIKAKRQRVVSK